jgi:hypothetical protein
MRYLKSYNIFESDNRLTPIDDETKSAIMDTFIGVQDMIDAPNHPSYGVKIGRTSNRDIRDGASANFIKVNVLPKIYTHGWSTQQQSSEYEKSVKDIRQFRNLRYAPSYIEDNFYTELLDSIRFCAGVNNLTLTRVTVAWANGGETGGSGEFKKSFTPDGGELHNQGEGLRKGAYNLEYLEEMLRNVVKDRLRWIKIFYSDESVTELNHYQELSELKKNINDIVYYEFGDGGVEYEIKPDNEIGVKMLSLKQRGLLDERGDEFAPFYIDIDTTNLRDKIKRSGSLDLPEWFREVILRIEGYLSSQGYEMTISIRLPGAWEEMSIDDLMNFHGHVFNIRLKFKK